MLERLKSFLFSNRVRTRRDDINIWQKRFRHKNPYSLTNGQVALLSHFSIGAELQEFGWYAGWWIAFGHINCGEMLQMLVEKGLLVPATVKDYPDTLNMKQLRIIIKKLGHRVPPKKEGMVKLLQDLNYDVRVDFPRPEYWICSEEAKSYVEKYCEEGLPTS